MIRFTVYGKPATAGSKRAIALMNKKTGTPIVDASGRPRVNVIHDNKRFTSWRQDVAAAALRTSTPWFGGPVVLSMTWYAKRPQSHFHTGKRSGELRSNAPAVPIVKPDLTKILRALEDSLTGVIWRDDCQVVSLFGRKVYCDDTPERVVVNVWDWSKDFQALVTFLFEGD